jgi:tetratricopeptide (TPR) repeat protein
MPAAADACLCGSGMTFGRCCRDHLPGFANGAALRQALRNHDLSAAMIAARADVTQYIIWHHTNTEPLVRAGHPVGAAMLDIDVNALGAAVDELVHVHWLSNATKPLMGVLDRLRYAIRSPRWDRKMTYFQVITEEIPNNNPEAARREFIRLLPITDAEDDIEILQACVSLYADTLSFARMIAICDHILRLSDSLAVAIQYTAVKAGQYLLIDDVQQAGLLFDQVASKARKAQNEGKLDLYEEWLFATTLAHLGLLKREGQLFDEAIRILKGQLAIEGWKPGGVERLHRAIGDCHRYAGRWAEAEAAYRAAVATLVMPAATIFLAEVIWRQGRVHEAESVIDGVAPGTLDPSEYEDFTFAAAAIAVESGDRVRMARAAHQLEGFRATAPYFERRRLALLLQVNRAIEHGRTPTIVRSIRRLMAATARSVSRYAVLEPNISGIGLNFNHALDDLADHLDPLPDKPHPSPSPSRKRTT